MRRYLVLNFRAPLMYFGGAPTPSAARSTDFPLRGLQASSVFPVPSMVAGLLANALGWHRSDQRRIAAMQDALRYAAGYVGQTGADLRQVDDLQGAQLGADDRGWTTRGMYEGRRGAPATYESPVSSWSTYLADTHVRVALRIETGVALDEVAAALLRPARPLFIGRKACLPEEPVFLALCESSDALAALVDHDAGHAVACWSPGEGPDGDFAIELGRRGDAGVHSGTAPFFVRVPKPFSLVRSR